MAEPGVVGYTRECGRIATAVVQMLTEQALPIFHRFLQCPIFCENSARAPLVRSRIKKLKQEIKRLLLLKASFLTACENLSTYGTDEGVYQGINKDNGMFKIFLNTCCERIMSVLSCYDKACGHIKTVKDKLDEEIKEFTGTLTASHTRSLLGNVAYGIGAVGVTTAAVFASPLTAPVAGVAIVALGATGVGGTVSGYLLKNFDKEEDLQAVSRACEILLDCQTFVHDSSTDFQDCHQRVNTAAENIRSLGFFERGAPQPGAELDQENQSTPRYRVNDSIHDKSDNLHRPFMLSEFKASMEKLKIRTCEIKTKIDDILAGFQ